MNYKDKTTILAIAALPFYLNDFSTAYVTSFTLWIAIDYTLKLLPLWFLFRMLQKRHLTAEDLGLVRMSLNELLTWAVILTTAGFCLDEPGIIFWSGIFPMPFLDPAIMDSNPILNQIDMTFGLALVAIAEEVIFRGLAFSALKERGYSTPKIFIVSAAIFGLIHWSQGPAVIIATAITGSALMVCRWRSGSIYPAIIAHYFINYLAFSGMASDFWTSLIFGSSDLTPLL